MSFIAFKQAARVYLRVTMIVAAGMSLLGKGPIVAICFAEVQSLPGECLVPEWREDLDGIETRLPRNSNIYLNYRDFRLYRRFNIQ